MGVDNSLHIYFFVLLFMGYRHDFHYFCLSVELAQRLSVLEDYRNSRNQRIFFFCLLSKFFPMWYGGVLIFVFPYSAGYHGVTWHGHCVVVFYNITVILIVIDKLSILLFLWVIVLVRARHKNWCRRRTKL